MKNTILHWTSVLLASSAMMLSACSSDDTDNEGGSGQAPIFPEEAQLTIFAGETNVELSFTPNLDWTASLSASSDASRWFKISDGVMESAVSISGYASQEPVTLYITTTDEEVYDQTPTCEVLLTMGGETKTIARITRSNAAREFAIYASGYEEGLGFNYDFGSTPLTKFDGTEAPETAEPGTPEFQWPIGTGGFMHVIKVESNFDWLVSAPSWISLAERSTGDGTYFVNVDIDKISEEELGGAVALLDFYDADIDKITDPGNSAHNRYCFELPAINQVVRHPSALLNNPTLNFNAAGEYVSESINDETTASPQYTGTVSSTEGLTFYVAELVHDAYSGSDMYMIQNEFTKWVTVEDTWDETRGLFQEHTYTITVDANEGEARTAKVIALPKVLADQITTPQTDLIVIPDMNDFNEAYKPYVFATIEQEGIGGGEETSDEFISINPAVIDRFEGASAIASFRKIDPNSEEDYNFFMDNMGNDHIISYAQSCMYDGIPGYILTCTENLLKQEDIASSPVGTLLVSSTYDRIKIYPDGTSWLMCEEVATENDKMQLLISTGEVNDAPAGSSATIVFQRVVDNVPMGTLGVVFIIRDYGTSGSEGEGGEETPEI